MHEKGGVGSIGYKLIINKLCLVIIGPMRKLIRIYLEHILQLYHPNFYGRLLKSIRKKDTFLKSIFQLIGISMLYKKEYSGMKL